MRIPSRWELKALVRFSEEEMPTDYYISGIVGHGLDDFPEPYLPGYFPGAGGVTCPRAEHRNIEEIGLEIPESTRTAGSNEVWVDQLCFE